MSILHPLTRKTAPVGETGFTLVELLVVIAIISLLVTVLTIAMGRVRERVKLVMCQTNLRNVGIGVTAYLAENGKFLPASQEVTGPHTEMLAGLAGKYVEPECFYCPAEDRPELSFNQANLQAGTITYFYYSCRNRPTNYDISHFLWRNGTGHPDWPRLITVDGVQGATEWISDPWILSDRWVSGEIPHPFGQKGLNFLLLGGEVRMVKSSPREEFK